jgi:hypothetical protein
MTDFSESILSSGGETEEYTRAQLLPKDMIIFALMIIFYVVDMQFKTRKIPCGHATGVIIVIAGGISAITYSQATGER